ncbi:MAG: hypothetical protein ACI955_002279, partial [Zhongshania sp.]
MGDGSQVPICEPSPTDFKSNSLKLNYREVYY